MALFKIKICGVTNHSDALRAATAGADAIGLNFYSKSPRYVEPARAREIVQGLPETLKRVGVFVNAEVSLIQQHVDALNLSLVQLHGDETPEDVAALRGAPVVKAFRLDGQNEQPIVEFVRQCQARQLPLVGVLIDAAQPGVYGGTGKTVDWSVAARLREALADVSMVLAGGLRPENVAAAVAAVRPAAVDTASGVEARPGVKDHLLVDRFVAEARAALDLLG